jgi:hypothetical protein
MGMGVWDVCHTYTLNDSILLADLICNSVAAFAARCVRCCRCLSLLSMVAAAVGALFCVHVHGAYKHRLIIRRVNTRAIVAFAFAGCPVLLMKR